MLTATQQRQRPALIRKVRRLIGKGRSTVERGSTWMDFDERTYTRAFVRLCDAFGPPQITVSGRPATIFTDPKTRLKVRLYSNPAEVRIRYM